ncbi:MAG: hypothetical protein ACPHL6_01705 [Rubripirellula sp.]
MNSNYSPNRNAFTSTELVVACSLLVTSISTVAMIAVKTTRIWQDSRHQQIALEELSSQIDRLTSLSPKARTDAIRELKPSDLLIAISPNVTITATWDNEEKTAIKLQVDWNSVQPKAPVRLIGWVSHTLGGDQP